MSGSKGDRCGALFYGEDFVVTAVQRNQGLCQGYKKAHSFNPDCAWVRCPISQLETV